MRQARRREASLSRPLAAALPALLSLLILAAAPLSAEEYGLGLPVVAVTTPTPTGYAVSFRSAGAGSVTVTLRFTRLENAATEPPAPLTITVRAGATEPCVTVAPLDPAKAWDSYFMYDYQLGLLGARHDEALPYRLPYRAGEAYLVGQGYEGRLTHRDEYRHSIDFLMPAGTPVLAARAGVVVDAVERFEGAGLTDYYRERNNYVFVEQADGTIARYVHFRKDGVAVEPGRRVEAGELLGYSGDVGYSGGPHLHFSVHRPSSGAASESLPTRFFLEDGSSARLEEGKSYRAGP